MSPFQIPSQAEIPTGSAYLGEGTHEVTIDEVDTGTSSKNNPQIIVTFKDAQGRTIRDWVTITERAMWRVQLLWEAAGLAWPQDGGQIDENDLFGRRLLIVVAPEEYGGVVRNKVKDYQQLVGSDIPMDLGVPPAAPASAIGGADDEPVPF